MLSPPPPPKKTVIQRKKIVKTNKQINQTKIKHYFRTLEISQRHSTHWDAFIQEKPPERTVGVYITFVWAAPFLNVLQLSCHGRYTRACKLWETAALLLEGAHLVWSRALSNSMPVGIVPNSSHLCNKQTGRPVAKLSWDSSSGQRKQQNGKLANNNNNNNNKIEKWDNHSPAVSFKWDW